MKKKKRLTADSVKPESEKGKKKLTSDSSDSPASAEKGEGKKLTREEAQLDTQPASAPQPPLSEEIQGEILHERIHFSTLAGGLTKIPDNFNDSDGDWVVIKSKDNPFECLYLDYREYEKITREMVERNYRILSEFWQDKIRVMDQGATRVVIIQKYAGPEGSDRTVRNYPNILKQAYERLSQPNGIEHSYYEIEKCRQEMIRKDVEPFILLALKDKVLEPSEEVDIKNYCRTKTDLSEKEIDELIEEYLKKTNSIRGEGGGGIGGPERVFFNFIKGKLKDKFLTIEEEEELIASTQDSPISPQRYEELVLKALHEIDESEREKTFEQDKQNFRQFYYELLKDFSLTADDNLPEVATEKLVQRGKSEREFFPLNHKTRHELIQESVKKYKIDLEAEKQRFFESALQKLDRYDGHVEAKQEMLKDAQYLLLLPVMREEIIRKAMAQIIEKQANGFTEAAKKYYQLQHWKISQKEGEEFVAVPDQLSHTGGLRYDWLEKERRVSLFVEVMRWADEQHAREITIITEMVRNELKKHIYGLPLDLQNKIENDQGYYLDHSERREIIISLEEPHRLDAEKKFTSLVIKSLVFETLIPEVEQNLLEKGSQELLLTPEKNAVSFKVKTAREIIDSLRKTFEEILNKQVQELANSRRMEDQLIKEFNLDYTAYISQTDVESFVKRYKPADNQEKKTVRNTFEKYAGMEQLYIVPHNAKADFAALLEKTMEKASEKYKWSLKRWLTPQFEENMVKVGAAYGVPEGTVKSELNHIRGNYPQWTLPTWSKLILWFLVITGGFLLLRILVSLTGYWDWIFISGPVKHYELNELIETIDINSAWRISRGGTWLLTAIVFIILAIWIFKKRKQSVNLLVLIMAVVMAYFLTPVIIVVIGNIFIGIGNFFIYVWYFLQNTWAYIVTGLSYLDYIVCFPPFNPLINWGLFAGILGVVIAFILSVNNKRRSYWKMNLIFSAVALILLTAFAIASQKVSRGYLARESLLSADSSLSKVTIETSSGIYADTTGGLITTVPKGAKVYFESEEGKRYKIKYNSLKEIIEGYVYTAAFRLPKPSAPTAIYGVIINQNGATIRSGPGTNYSRIGVLPAGAQVVILSEGNEWFLINNKDASGYVHKSLIRHATSAHAQKQLAKSVKTPQEPASPITSPGKESKQMPLEPRAVVPDPVEPPKKLSDPSSSVKPSSEINNPDTTARSQTPNQDATSPTQSMSGPETSKTAPGQEDTKALPKSPEQSTGVSSTDENMIVPFYALTEKPVEIERVNPVYPSLAQKSKIEGTVVVKVLVGINGNVEKVEVLKSHPLLDNAAVEAAKQFKFVPGKQNGKPVKTWVSIPFNFKLH